MRQWLYEQDQQYSWHSQLDTQQEGGLRLHRRDSWQDTQQLEKPKRLHRMEESSGHQIVCEYSAAVISAWALVEDWEAVDNSPDSIEKVLQVVSSFLPKKVAQMATCSMG